MWTPAVLIQTDHLVLEIDVALLTQAPGMDAVAWGAVMRPRLGQTHECVDKVLCKHTRKGNCGSWAYTGVAREGIPSNPPVIEDHPEQSEEE